MNRMSQSMDDDMHGLKSKFHNQEGNRNAKYDASMARKSIDSMPMKRPNTQGALGNSGSMMNMRPRTSVTGVGNTNMSTDSKKSNSSINHIHPEEQRKLEKTVLDKRRKYDQLRQLKAEKERQVQQAQQYLNELESEGVKPNEEEPHVAKKIRSMENRLGRIIIKYNEAENIRKTYQQIVKRLREERIGFDNQIGSIEKTLKLKCKDYDELLLMSQDANHARDVAKNELAVLTNRVNENRRGQSKELAETKRMVQASMDFLTDQLEKQRQAMYSGPDEKAKKKALNVVNEFDAVVTDEEAIEMKLQQFEDGFRRIKEATGVDEAAEVLQRFFNQKETLDNLQTLKNQALQRIEELIDLKGKCQQNLEDHAYRTATDASGRHVVDELEQQMFDAQAKCERNRMKYERLGKLLVDARSGVEHMADKLDIIKIDRPSNNITDDNIIEVLDQAEKKLLKLVEAINYPEDVDKNDPIVPFIPQSLEAAVASGNSPVKQDSKETKKREPKPELKKPSLVYDAREQLLSPFNLRVSQNEDEATESEDSGEDEMDDVPDRELMKRMATIMVEKASKRTKKGKKRAFSADSNKKGKEKES